MNQSLSIALKSLVLIFLIHLLINNFQKKTRSTSFSDLFNFTKKSTVTIENYQNKINALELKINNIKHKISNPTTSKKVHFKPVPEIMYEQKKQHCEQVPVIKEKNNVELGMQRY